MLTKYQQGVGLLEVLVALLLLAVAVLGFSAMQLRSMQATNETLTRSDAMVMVRNVAESVRLSPTLRQKKAYADAINNAATKTNAIDCQKKSCSLAEQATYNAKQALLLADESNIKLAALDCPIPNQPKKDTDPKFRSDNIKRMCLIASWDETQATMDDNASNNPCTKTDGTYHPKSSCIVMETY